MTPKHLPVVSHGEILLPAGFKNFSILNQKAKNITGFITGVWYSVTIENWHKEVLL